MKILLLVFGETDRTYIQKAIDEYIHRINYFCPFEMEIIPKPKNHGRIPPMKQIQIEADLFLQKTNANDMIILLDEKGEKYTSQTFAKQMEQWMNSGKKRIIFIIGGAYGIYKTLKQNYLSVSLSQMTFNHQIVRLLFVEQVYRAFTILKGLPYHNE